MKDIDLRWNKLKKFKAKLKTVVEDAITATPKSYNGVIVGKSECRSGPSYFTDDHTNVLISGYNNNGWQSAGCRTNNSSSDVSALINKATVLYYQGNYTQAIQYYDKALAVDPNDKYALDGKGKCSLQPR
jgi:tetratricopeptide (TPR) repeat protein